MKYVHAAVIDGRIPPDMLRYDACKIISPGVVTRTTRSKALPWTIARWASFGCRITSTTVEKVTI